MTQLRFDSKDAARHWVWDRLQAEGFARPPYPTHGRIPNFADADLAADRLFKESPWREAGAIKCSPDSPQRVVRYLALKLGICVYVPTPRLAGGFQLLDPSRIRTKDFAVAATLATMTDHSVPVSLEDLPQMDGIVAGSTAVTRTGKRCGKGAGYSDIEFALLAELGHQPVPVATTVHDVQLVADFPIEAVDQPLTLICTPTQSVRITHPLPAPDGIDWARLDERAVAEMVVLKDLKQLQERGALE